MSSESPSGGVLAQRALDNLEAVPERLGRRSFLGRASRLLLAATGVAFASSTLPVDRRPARASHNGECDTWTNCGLCGQHCESCGYESTLECPSGTLTGGYWTWCCDNGLRIYRIRYTDCCGQLACGTFCDNNCDNANTAWCGSYAYHCTLTRILESCT